MQTLDSIQDFERVLQSESLLLIFKHSTRCPISSAALGRFSRYIDEAGAAAPPACLINVVECRPVSNEAAARLGVPHQSPQLILTRNGAALWNASHGAITAQAIQEALKHQS